MADTTRPPTIHPPAIHPLVDIIAKSRPIPARWVRPDPQYLELVAGARRVIAASRDLLERTKDFHRGD